MEGRGGEEWRGEVGGVEGRRGRERRVDERREGRDTGRGKGRVVSDSIACVPLKDHQVCHQGIAVLACVPTTTDRS